MIDMSKFHAIEKIKIEMLMASPLCKIIIVNINLLLVMKGTAYQTQHFT